ncbi:MAG: S1 RNA-binding domain-containing protein, partial [Clostridia bacterium]|nr:S1 RNA-binding domain-containing protein [Clostridia bacterium]
GATYPATVVKILASKDKPGEDIGCFVEYAPGKDGMVHISKICDKRINKVTDAGIDVGSVVKVKYMGLDKKGRMDFSIKDAE